MQNSKLTNVLLWTVQALLALFFGLASGAPKLFLPPEMLALPIPLSDPFLKFIGVAEVLGALGLILPGVLRIQTGVTPVAAACLALVTACATVYQLMAGQPESAVFATVIGLIAAFVAYGRWRLAPLGGSSHRAVLAAP